MINTPKKNVVLYARTSMSDQNSNTQLMALRDYCNRMDYNITHEYVDDGCSGKDTNRPQFELLMNDMREKRFNTILTFKIDRIGRSLQHLLSFLQELRKKQIDFISLSENLDTSTSHGELIWSILGAFAQYERSIIIERTKAGLNRAKREGKRLGRPKGSTDKKVRRKSGYYTRWAKIHSK